MGGGHLPPEASAERLQRPVSDLRLFFFCFVFFLFEKGFAVYLSETGSRK